jgi:DNA-binding MarR family transcriptional regulator
LGRRHSLPVLLSLYRHGSVSTSGLIRELDAHPATVIAVLRDLERLGVLRRFPEVRRRHEIRATLTLRGIGLLETPLYHWGRLIREWGSVP